MILAVIGAGAGLGFALTGKSTAAGASEVFLQPANAQGQNPFTPNVGTDASVPSTASGALTPTSGTSLASYSGNSVGLYGGTLDQSSCNPQQMITYLQANPSKASAWAAAEGISVNQISTYIGGLTPMTLRYDTRVTNHGYVNGQANAIPEILQAGQAVLVDSHGVPRARCYCGNPLTPPEAVSGSPHYVGAQWSEFSPTTVIVVQQSTTVINNFTLINNSTGQAFSRPAGTTGTSDTPAPTCTGGPSMPGVTVCTNPTTTTTRFRQRPQQLCQKSDLLFRVTRGRRRLLLSPLNSGPCRQWPIAQAVARSAITTQPRLLCSGIPVRWVSQLDREARGRSESRGRA